MSSPAIQVRDLGKEYKLGERQARGYKSARDVIAGMFKRSSGNRATKETFWALKDVSFDVQHGEVLGVIGRNGAGKSTLLKVLTRITEPTRGEVRLRGRVGSLLEVGTGFHPELTGRENIYLNGAILGMHRRETAAKFDEIVDFAEVEQFIDTPVKRYSSGMYLRLAFAVAAHLEPEILLVDEVLAVGDAAFQKKCLGKMGDVARAGRTVLFVSHNMAAIQNLCQRACLLQRGEVIAIGEVTDIITTYLQTAEIIDDGAIEHRKDRQGNAKLRFVSFKADNFICGSPTQFSIAYKGTTPLRNVHISTSFSNIFGEPVAYLSNDLTQDLFSEVASKGEFICRFEKLPLLPGTYTLNLYCTVNGIIADWITNAATIQVIEGDFYGTGKLPSQSYKVAISHEWKAVDDKH